MLASKRVMSREAALALDLDARIKLEEHITDAKAPKIDIPTIPDSWTFSDYTEEYPWRSYEFRFLGPLAGKSILDLGCGYHPTPIYFALAGAERVCACDVSPKAVQFMRRVANIYGVADRVTVYESPAEKMPFASGEFDLMHGEPCCIRDDARAPFDGQRRPRSRLVHEAVCAVRRGMRHCVKCKV